GGQHHAGLPRHAGGLAAHAARGLTAAPDVKGRSRSAFLLRVRERVFVRAACALLAVRVRFSGSTPHSMSRFVIALLVALVAPLESPSMPQPTPQHATGAFEVKLTPVDDKRDPQLARMLLDKQYHGDLDATSIGQMLSAMTDTKGSAGYVAIEKVTGK